MSDQPQITIQVVGDDVTPDQIAAPRPWHGLDEDALTAAHLAVEDELVDLRDRRISVLGPRNGFVIREYNGETSSILRMGTREGLAIGIAAYLAATRADPPMGLHDSESWQ